MAEKWQHQQIDEDNTSQNISNSCPITTIYTHIYTLYIYKRNAAPNYAQQFSMVKKKKIIMILIKLLSRNHSKSNSGSNGKCKLYLHNSKLSKILSVNNTKITINIIKNIKTTNNGN